MAPLLLPNDANRAETLAAAHRSAEFIHANMAKWMDAHAQEFVVVYNGELVAMHKDADTAKDMARRSGYNLDHCVMTFIPVPGITCYY